MDAFAPIDTSAAKPKKAAKPASQWVCVMPAPTNAPPAPDKHPSLGAPVGKWHYTDANGATLGFACRFETKAGKQFRPLALFKNVKTNALEWKWESWQEPRPLYGLHGLALHPQAHVILCEGEKAADAAQKLLPDCVAIASPNGAKSASKADWTPLKNRTVIIWPDADLAGTEYAIAAAKFMIAAGVASVKIITPPTDKEQGWDAADALQEGWQLAQAQALVDTACDFEADKPLEEKDTAPVERERRIPQGDTLMALCNDIELWHSPDKEAYATIEMNNHRENHEIRSSHFKRYLIYKFYKSTQKAPSNQALESTFCILESLALNERPQKKPLKRIGTYKGNFYLDLCNLEWDVVEVTPQGWQVVKNSGVPFIRKDSNFELPTPQGGYDINGLRNFINLEREDDFILIVAWLLGALCDKIKYPVLCLGGEQGSGKSSISVLLRSLIDPNKADIRALPREERDLIVGAINSHIIALDNVSKLEPWLADSLCGLATGRGFSSRSLHTNSEEHIIYACCPIILNGIPSLTDRPDLGDRAITVRLPVISNSNRKTTRSLDTEWDTVRPRIMGALLDAYSAGLRNLPNVKLKELPRMADFAEWIVACESGLGWDTGTFMDVYMANRKEVTNDSFEANPVAVAVVDLIKNHKINGFEGTATQLLAALDMIISDVTRKSMAWPKTAQGLGNAMDRVAGLVRSKGLAYQKVRANGQRIIIIMPADKE